MQVVIKQYDFLWWQNMETYVWQPELSGNALQKKRNIAEIIIFLIIK